MRRRCFCRERRRYDAARALLHAHAAAAEPPAPRHALMMLIYARRCLAARHGQICCRFERAERHDAAATCRRSVNMPLAQRLQPRQRRLMPLLLQRSATAL